jgi:hypothetical protein
MPEDTRDRVIAMEQKIAHHADILERIDSKLDCVLEKSTARDVKMTSIEKSVSEMAPSVQAVKDGLVFWRVGKYLAGLGLSGAAYYYGFLDWIKSLVAIRP